MDTLDDDNSTIREWKVQCSYPTRYTYCIHTELLYALSIIQILYCNYLFVGPQEYNSLVVSCPEF